MTVSLAFHMRINSPVREVSSQLDFDELSHPVNINFDAIGIPHVEAETTRDLFIANGYLMAKDRLWGMDFYRRQAKGQLSEIFSVFEPEIIETDYSLRAIGLYRIAERDWPLLTQKTKDYFQYFAEGVNIFIEDNRNHLPIEFGILGYEPELWTPLDSLSIIKLMAVGLTFHGGGEPIIGEGLQIGINESLLLGFAQMALNDPDIKWSEPIAYPSKNDNVETNSYSEINDITNVLTGALTPSFSSNNWVVSGEKTKSGLSFLANDPHLGLETPSVWWQVDLKGPEFHIAGMVMPGIPGIILGRNQYVAWGATNSQIDFLDTYVESFTDDYSQYLYKGSYRETKIISERFYKNSEKTWFEDRNIYITEGDDSFSHGERPVTPMLGENVSIRWVAQDSSRIAELISLLPFISNYDEFNQTISYWNAPGQNIVYMDKIGNIALWVSGDIPIRKSGYGFAPHNGSLDTYEWMSYVPFSEHYHVLNPVSGYIVTANERFIPKNYSHHLGWAFDNSYRGDRIKQLLEAGSGIHNFNTMKDIQTDIYSLASLEYLSVILNRTYAINDNIRTIQAILRDWDNEYRVDSIGASILAVWIDFFLKITFNDQIPEKLLNNVPIKGKLITNTLNDSESNSWTDDINTAEIETKGEVIVESLNETYNYLQEKFGSDTNNWKWGFLHKVRASHIFGDILDFFNGINNEASPGADDTVAVGSYNKNYLQNHGPSMRQIFSLEDTKSYYSVLPPGNSGVINSQHFTDQKMNWITGSYFAVPINFEEE
jgi:penicillin amidase